MISRSRSKTPLSANPSILKGKNNSQMMGYNNKTPIATGALMRKRMIQSKKVIISVKEILIVYDENYFLIYCNEHDIE